MTRFIAYGNLRGVGMQLSDQELEALMSAVESDRVERKESFRGDAPEKLRQAICAFANDLPNHKLPGVVFVGARDDGAPTGLDVSDELLRNLADIKSDGKLTPPPTMTVAKRTLGGKDVAVITVLPAEAPPVRLDGRIWIRTGPRRGIASRQDETILNEKRRFRDRPFDIQPLPSSRLSDLDRYYYESKYLPATVASDILAANDRSFEERLASSKMIVAVNEPTPTLLGVLVAGNRPADIVAGGYIQFLRLDGPDLSSPVIDEQRIDGKLAEVVQGIDAKFKAHNRTRVDIVSRDVETRQSDYALVALEQFVRNALIHRSYEHTHAPVKVNWFGDRVEIISPGGPFGYVTKDNFGQPGLAEYRNPNIAEAMKGLGFVQRFGIGIQTAIAALKKNGNPPPQFDVSDHWVRVVVRR